MHVIGHSLGAHIASYIGYHLRTDYGYTLGRITGLDPSGPLFRNTPPLVRLDPTDADFVEAIHTNSAPVVIEGLGIDHPVGHIDFYPNGGSEQPGCEKEKSIIRKSWRLLFRREDGYNCHHARSHELFTESINTECPFLAVPCASWDDFLGGKCFDCANGESENCHSLGFHTNDKPGNYNSVYLMTGNKSPFCKGHYRVEMNISNGLKNYKYMKSKFVMRVIGASDEETENLQLSETPKYYKPGSTHIVVVPGDIVGELKTVELTWLPEKSYSQKELFQSEIKVDSFTIDSLESPNGATVCLDGSTTLVAYRTQTLTVANCKNADVDINSPFLD